jgi:hypothetical protein
MYALVCATPTPFQERADTSNSSRLWPQLSEPDLNALLAAAKFICSSESVEWLPSFGSALLAFSGSHAGDLRNNTKVLQRLKRCCDLYFHNVHQHIPNCTRHILWFN